jgi:hypothetical protein
LGTFHQQCSQIIPVLLDLTIGFLGGLLPQSARDYALLNLGNALHRFPGEMDASDHGAYGTGGTPRTATAPGNRAVQEA